MGFVYKGLKGVPYRKLDCEKIRCTSRDFGSLALAGRLYIAAAGKLGELVIGPRIKGIPGAWQKYRSGVALLGRAMDAAFQTVPDDQFERLSTIFDHGTIDINLPKSKINNSGGSILAVDGKALANLTYYAMRNECSICLKEGGEAKRCELYQALKGVIEPDTWQSYGCPWRDVIIETLSQEREEQRGKGGKK